LPAVKWAIARKQEDCDMAGAKTSGLTDAGLRKVFTSPDVSYADQINKAGIANVVDVIDTLAHEVRQVAEAVADTRTPRKDDLGRGVGSLTESVACLANATNNVADALNGEVALSLDRIAKAIDGLAEAVAGKDRNV
jgi:hypothetical protein